MAWYGYDLDGTTFEYHGWKGSNHIGKPIPKIIERIKEHLSRGEEVRIVTARVSPAENAPEDIKKIVQLIEAQCEEHIGQKLKVTSDKDYGMIYLVDDRAKQVVPNMGITLEEIISELQTKMMELKKEIAELKAGKK